MSTPGRVAISVVVPTRGRPLLLARCLRALTMQSLPAGAFEVVVCDDGPDDETRAAVIHAADAGLNVRYIPVTETHGPAAARNAGWRAASGPVIAFTDDDCIPEPQWLENGLEAIRAGAAGVEGRVVVPLPARPTDYERTIGWLEDAGFVTANCFCRRDALAAIGGFDERFRAAWREDSDLYFTLLEYGASVRREPRAVVVHPARRASWGVSIREQRKTMYNALLYRKHPRLYREVVQPRPAFRYYAIVLALAAVAGAIALQPEDRGWLAVPAGAWVVLTGAFCHHRLRRTRKSLSHFAEMALTSAVIPPLSVFWRLYGSVRYRTLVL